MITRDSAPIGDLESAGRQLVQWAMSLEEVQVRHDQVGNEVGERSNPVDISDVGMVQNSQAKFAGHG